MDSFTGQKFSNKKLITASLIVFLVHFSIQLGVFFLWGLSGVLEAGARDTQGPISSGIFFSVLNIINLPLSFILFQIGSFTLFLLNSVIWGLAFYILTKRYLSSRGETFAETNFTGA